VVYRRLDDRIVLIDLASNQIFDLNETSARLWELVVAVGELPEISAVLAEEYDVDHDQLQRELSETLARFAKDELITGYAPA